MDTRLSIPKKMAQSPKNKFKNVKNTAIDPIQMIKMREDSGDRIDMANLTKYFN